MIDVIFDLLRSVSAWLQNLTTFETAMFVMIFWISATIASLMLQYAGWTKRGFGAATLMYGSFVLTAIMVAFLVFAGLSA